MSPPKVTLAVKEPPQVSEEEIPSEKMVKPVIVTVDTEAIRCHRHKAQAKRRRHIACRGALAIVLIVIATAAVGIGIKLHHRRHNRHHQDAIDHVFGSDSSSSSSSEESDSEEKHYPRRWNCRVGKGQDEEVWVEPDNQLIHAKHGHLDDETHAFHVLHEYNRRMAAYKDLDKNVCYITRLDETYAQGYARWQAYMKTGRKTKTLHVLTESSQRVEVTVLRHITDVHIYAHCKNAQTYWAVEIDERKVTIEMTIVKV